MGDGMLAVKSSWVCELSLKDDVQLQRAYASVMHLLLPEK